MGVAGVAGGLRLPCGNRTCGERLALVGVGSAGDLFEIVVDLGVVDVVHRAFPTAQAGGCFQFERLGYFCVDLGSVPGQARFNRTVTLRDSWAKVAGTGD